MFIGHFALAFGAKKVAPNISLGTLFMAAQLADLLWPTLLLLGIERVEIHPGMTAFTPLDFVNYPYSHSLAALLGWAIAAAVILAVARGLGLRAGLVIAALVLSHWAFDTLTHRPDMPLTIGGPERFGLGLWDSVPRTITVEVLLLSIGVALYAEATEAIDRKGSIGLWTLVAFLLIAYGANILGPPPPSSAAVAWAGESMWLLVAWAWWADRHRRPGANPV